MSNTPIAPMVNEPTRAESTNVETIVSRLRNGRVIIPDYQRDADQWDNRKESLFIESLLNNLTIPAFFFAENADGSIEVVDGQQRLTTILRYANDDFSISPNDDIVYLAPQSTHYKGKRFSELPPRLRNVFNDYPLAIIYLPRDLELGVKLEIFRRINEGGTPLTAQDIRLAYYSKSPSVFFIRLSGIYSTSDAAKRMIQWGKEKGVLDPWGRHPEVTQLWQDWWKDKRLAKGQTPAEMFLWYLVLRYRRELDNLLSSSSMMSHLPLGFRGTTEEALDIYCAQLQYTDVEGGTKVFPTYNDGLEYEFNEFIRWINIILSYGSAGMSVDKYKQIALFIGAAVELKVDPQDIHDDAWISISEFIRKPRSSGKFWLSGDYPETKGRWTGQKGQMIQCEKAVELVSKIINNNI